MPALDPEVAGQQHDELLEVAVERRVGRHLDAEVFEDRHAAGCAADHVGGLADLGFGDTGLGARLGDVDGVEVGAEFVEAVRVVGEPRAGGVLGGEDLEERCEEVGVAAGQRAEVDVGEVGRLGATGVDDDHRAVGVVGDRLEDAAGLGEAVRLPRVLAPEDRDLGVVVVAGGVAARLAEELTVDPELAGLLLGEGVGGVLDAEGGAGGRAVAAAEVVALAAAAVEEDLLAAVLVDHVLEASRDLGDGGVPVDRFERAVRAAPHRAGEAVRAVLVVVEAERLLTRVALAGRVRLVAADPLDRRSVELDLDPAVDRAQDARRLVPLVAHDGSVQQTNQPMSSEGRGRLVTGEVGGSFAQGGVEAAVVVRREGSEVGADGVPVAAGGRAGEGCGRADT